MARYCSGNNEPLTRWKNHPVYLTTILTALFVVGLVVSAVIGSMRSPVVEMLIFTMPLDPAWSLWRLVTYVFIDRLSFFTPFAIMVFYMWSIGIETHLGRWVLGKLLALLVLVVPAVGALAWWGFGQPSMSMGNYSLTCGLLVAFATLYPNTEVWGWIPFKWLAFACVVCGSLMLLADRDWIQLSQLWASCAVGFAYLNYAKDQEHDDSEPLSARISKLFRRQPKFRVLPQPVVRRRNAVADDEDIDSIDPLLDKIARTGLASLSAKERARLEEAREALLKKDRP